MVTPQFVHDCDNCVFVGRMNDYDIYTCTQLGNRTVVARFSDDGPGYFSGERVNLHNGLVIQLDSV
jgi:hypothetical protein